MKNIILNSATLLVMLAFVFISCDPDPIITGGDNTGDEDEAPLVTLLDADGFISKDTEIEVGEAFSVRVEFIAGTANLQSLTILEDGVKIDASRLSIAGIETANNPQLITNVLGGEFDVTIAADPAVTEERFYSYAFQVSDGKFVEETFLNINTIIPVDPTTPLDQTLVGVLLNSAGPSGTGGLDLDTGTGTGSNDSEAEIQDEGIDFDKDAGSNWRQQISGANGSTIRTVSLNMVAENLTFDKVDNKEQVLAAFSTGADVTGTDVLENPSDTTNDELVSAPLQVGDVFAVLGQTTGKYYLLQCTAVNSTSDSNTDSYEFSIKY